jgi:hypothetical protein
MKKFLTTLLLCVLCSLPVIGQSYAAYQGNALVPLPSAPNFGTYTRNGSVFYDTSYATSAGYTGPQPPVIRCTDANLTSSVNYQSYSAGQGGAGNARGLFNSNHTALVVNGSNVILFNGNSCGPSTGTHAGSGFAITTDMNTAGGGSSASLANFGTPAFDAISPTLLYYTGFVLSATNDVQAGTVTINTSSGAYTDNGIVTDFSTGIPVGSNAPAWQANHTYSTGQYVSYTLTSGQAPAWQSTHTYSLGDIVVPTTGNPSGCMFRVVQAGTSSSTQPTWGTGNCGYETLAGTDGTVKWGGTSAQGSFVYQLISSGGTSGSSTPAFVPISTGHPDMLTQVSDNGLTWINVGPNVVVIGGSVGWTDFAWQSKDGTENCMGISTNNYGWLTGPQGGNLSNYQGEQQGTGIYMVCYKTTTNIYVLYNTATGIMSTTTCSGGTGYLCTGGTWNMSPVGATTAITAASCGGGGFLHAGKSSSGDDYVTMPLQTSTNCSSAPGNPVVWKPFSSFNSTTSAQVLVGGLNHYGPGYSHLVNVGQSGSFNGGFTGGAYSQIYDLSNPTAIPNVSWLVSTCDTRHYTPGIVYTNPPCEFADAYDQHTSWAAAAIGGVDAGPACGSFLNLLTLNPNPYAPWQGEEMCFSTTPNWVYGGSTTGQQQWRFTHSFNSGTNSNFSVQFSISQVSVDGAYMAWGTDDLCGFGNTAGTSAALYPTGTTLCGQNWQPSFSYSTGVLINPFGATTGSGTNFGVYQVTTGGTSAGTAPAWFVCNSGTAGNTVTDGNGVVYTCIGSANGRGDVLIVALPQSYASWFGQLL